MFASQPHVSAKDHHHGHHSSSRTNMSSGGSVSSQSFYGQFNNTSPSHPVASHPYPSQYLPPPNYGVAPAGQQKGPTRPPSFYSKTPLNAPGNSPYRAGLSHSGSFQHGQSSPANVSHSIDEDEIQFFMTRGYDRENAILKCMQRRQSSQAQQKPRNF